MNPRSSFVTFAQYVAFQGWFPNLHVLSVSPSPRATSLPLRLGYHVAPRATTCNKLSSYVPAAEVSCHQQIMPTTAHPDASLAVLVANSDGMIL
mmetsp:Transcript_4289/g.9318  ORF Transcript_4289/g.9318 Transcript_4289/m.9318 type:complete len:94 (-) Transcript_4289:90-371(-)